MNSSTKENGITSTSRKCQKKADFGLCFICQTKANAPITEKLAVENVEKFMNAAKERNSYGEIEYAELVERFLELPEEDLISSNVKYHRNCYKNLTNKAKIEAAKERYERGKASGRLSDVTQKKVGRPSTPISEMSMPSTLPTENKMTRRKSSASYNNELCAFCQENKKDNAPHEVRSESMGARIKYVKYVAENSSDQSLKIRLANLIASEDAKTMVAFDIKYHLACLISAERFAESSISQQSQPKSDISLLLSDMEIVEILELELNDFTGKILNMNDINAAYINLLAENSVKNLRSDY